MADKKTCFVIMPFDNGCYDKRFNDIYKPGIEAAGLLAYRVDEERTARKPINSIHEQIAEAHICFAEISTDKPNVWYELAYARACHKEIVLVCEENRVTPLPFDLDRMRILFHLSESTSDFEKLERDITEETLAVAEMVTTKAPKMPASIFVDRVAFARTAKRIHDIKNSLTSFDRKVMNAIYGICSDGETSALETMIAASCVPTPVSHRNKIAVRVSITALARLGLIKKVGRGPGNDPAYQPTLKGQDWFFKGREEKKQ